VVGSAVHGSPMTLPSAGEPTGPGTGRIATSPGRQNAGALHDATHHPENWRVPAEAAAAGDTTLLHSSRGAEHDDAVALRTFLLRSA
jgi:hypothetical protein